MKQVKDEKNKDKALEQVLADIEKQFGAGAIMKLGSEEHSKIDVTSSGSLSLDIALGVGDFLKAELLKFMDLNLLVKRRLLYKRLLRCKNLVVEQHLLMPNML